MVALRFAHGLSFSGERAQRGLTSSCLILEFSVTYHHQEKMFFKEIMPDERQSKLSPSLVSLLPQHAHLPCDLFCVLVESTSL